jgi:cell division protein ZapA
MQGDSTDSMRDEAQDSMRDEAQQIEARMSHVTVNINGRAYRMACEDGQEDHLSQLASGLNERVEQLRGSFGEIGDSRLVVMAALMLGDELGEAKQRIGKLEEELSGLQDARAAAAGRSQSTQAAVVAALNAAAERIERVTRGLNQSLGEGVGIG